MGFWALGFGLWIKISNLKTKAQNPISQKQFKTNRTTKNNGSKRTVRLAIKLVFPIKALIYSVAALWYARCT